MERYYTDIKPKIFFKNPKRVFSETNNDRTLYFVAFYSSFFRDFVGISSRATDVSKRATNGPRATLLTPLV